MRRITLLLTAALASLVLIGVPAQAVAQTDGITLGAVALNVADIPRAERFYTEVFGLVRTFQFPPDGEDKDLIEIGLGRPDQPGGMGLLLARLNDDPLPEEKNRYGRIVINSTDARALAARAVEAGATMLRDLTSPGGPILLFLSDLDGFEFEIYQPPPR